MGFRRRDYRDSVTYDVLQPVDDDDASTAKSPIGKINGNTTFGRLKKNVESGDDNRVKDGLELGIRFISIVQQNEPRFLRLLGFPATFEPLFRSAVEVLSGWDYTACSPSSPDEFDTEIESLKELQSVFSAVAEFFPALAVLCDKAAGSVGAQEATAAEGKAEAEQQMEESRAEGAASTTTSGTTRPRLRRTRPIADRPLASDSLALDALTDQLVAFDPIKHVFADL